MMRVSLFVIAFILMAALQAVAAVESFSLPAKTDLDSAGSSLRRALNAYENAAQDPVPQTWTRTTLTQGVNSRLGGDVYILLLPPSDTNARVMVVDDDGPQDAVLTIGNEATIGPLRIIAVSTSSSGRTAEVLVKARDAAALLAEKALAPSGVKISGIEKEHRIIVDAPDEESVRFARAFMTSLNGGASAEDSARAAWLASPPGIAEPSALKSAAAGVSTDSKNYAWGEDGTPFAAGVTLQLVRGDDVAIRELSTSWSYNSAGNLNSNPPVRVNNGAAGTTVDVGGRGDAFRARLRSLEKEGRLSVESETFVNVPLGGQARFDIQGPSGGMSAVMAARRAGGNGAIISISNQSGDWGFFGGVSTRVRLNEGQTVTLAKHSYSRTESQSSGVPIVSGIPYLGPLAGSQRSSSENSSFALFATMQFQ